jgi:hypothetical protein
MRTTLDIDACILKEIEALCERDGRPMGAVVSELLAEALAQRRPSSGDERSFRWASREMKALIDFSDREAICAALDGSTMIENAGRPTRQSRFAKALGSAEPGMTTDELIALLRGQPE